MVATRRICDNAMIASLTKRKMRTKLLMGKKESKKKRTATTRTLSADTEKRNPRARIVKEMIFENTQVLPMQDCADVSNCLRMHGWRRVGEHV
jgi:hypothetical protein